MRRPPWPLPAWGRSLAVYAGFVALVALYTFPLVLGLDRYLRPQTDSRLFTWVMGWVARQAFEAPRALFDGNIFYPHGNTIAYSEPLLVPAVVTFAPVAAWSGNPILAHNVTLVLFWALSGWAAYHVASRLTGSALGGWVAGIVFSLSSFRIGYYGIATMQLSFALPLAFLAIARFLERQRARDLLAGLFFVWCQMVSVWYFGIALALLLAGLGLGMVLLRPAGWQGRTVAWLLAGGAALGLALLPVAWPYLETRMELGFERSLNLAGWGSADLLSYLDVGRHHRLYALAESGRFPGLFPGFTAFGLAALAFLWLWGSGPADLPAPGRWARRLVTGGLLATVTAIAVFLWTGGGRLRVGDVVFRMSDLERATGLLLGLGAAALAFRGWAWARARRERTLTLRDWVALLGLLLVVFILLTLGPVMRVDGRAVGQGIFAVLFDLLPPLRVIRIPLRLAVVTLLLLGLLAAFGVAWAEARLWGRRARHALVALPLLLLAEYVAVPLPYHAVKWEEPPPIYRWLAAQPGDLAVLEWPSGHEYHDSVYVFWSLFHRKRLVHGVSGFVPPFTREIRAAVAALPAPEAVARLRSVYPLRWLLVHLNALPGEARTRWEAWGESPPAGLRAVGRLGEALVFGLDAGPEHTREWERTFSTDYVAAHPRARVTVALAGPADPAIRQTVEVTFNRRVLVRLSPTVEPVEVTFPLPRPYPAADRNRFRVEQRAYEILGPTFGDSRYRIGRTGVFSPVDLVVASAAPGAGARATIVVNGIDVAADRRGYNMAVVDPGSGRVTARADFAARPAESDARRLTDFVRDVPAGHIVVAALAAETAAPPAAEAVAALASLGGAAAPPDGPGGAHLLIGVKGAAPGSAVERVGPGRLEHVVGVDRRASTTLTLTDFRLE